MYTLKSSGVHAVAIPESKSMIFDGDAGSGMGLAYGDEILPTVKVGHALMAAKEKKIYE